MSEHTPGPWKLETVRTSTGVCHKVGEFPTNDSLRRKSSACLYDDCYSDKPRNMELLANAKLIASAPDLLAERDRLQAENRRLNEALVRIRAKADTGLREDGGRFALQALDAIDEIAEKVLREARAAIRGAGPHSSLEAQDLNRVSGVKGLARVRPDGYSEESGAGQEEKT